MLSTALMFSRILHLVSHVKSQCKRLSVVAQTLRFKAGKGATYHFCIELSTAAASPSVTRLDVLRRSFWGVTAKSNKLHVFSGTGPKETFSGGTFFTICRNRHFKAYQRVEHDEHIAVPKAASGTTMHSFAA